jgi:hypothetical protein
MTDFTPPSAKFMAHLRKNFISTMREIFPQFVFLREQVLKKNLTRIIARYNLPLVTLDKVYTEGGFHLELSRAVNEKFEDMGILERAGKLPLNKQIDHIVECLNYPEIVLADDVIFEGNAMCYAIDHFKKRGVAVRAVCVGVGIRDGLEKVNSLVDSVDCVYAFDRVIDEICERDFYPGAPLSGRTLAWQDNVGLPYIIPFGLPEKWASLPRDNVQAFSSFCIVQTIALFREIEKRSKKVVRCCDLPRKVYGLPAGNERYVNVLQRLL